MGSPCARRATTRQCAKGRDGFTRHRALQSSRDRSPDDRQPMSSARPCLGLELAAGVRSSHGEGSDSSLRMSSEGRVSERRTIRTSVKLDDANGSLYRDGSQHYSLDNRCADSHATIWSANPSPHAGRREDPVCEQRVDRTGEVTIEGCFVDVVQKAMSHFHARRIRRTLRPFAAVDGSFSSFPLGQKTHGSGAQS